MWARFFGVVLVLLSLVAAPRGARAYEIYPQVIRNHLGMSCAPPCILCHLDPRGGGPRHEGGFYLDLASLEGEFFEPGNELELTQLLDALEAGPCQVPTDDNFMTGPCNVDKDDMPDVAELRDGRDPNVFGPGLVCIRYGCGARLAAVRTTRSLDGGALAVGMGLVAFAARRRRAGAILRGVKSTLAKLVH